MKKIIALLPLLAFGLPHRPNQELELEEKQAAEIVKAGYAEYADGEVAGTSAKTSGKKASNGGGKKKSSVDNNPPAPSELEMLTAKALELKIEVPEGADVEALKALIAEAEQKQ